MIFQEKCLKEKICPYSGIFWSVFSRIRTEYRGSLRIQPKCGKMWTRKTPNTDTFHAVFINEVNLPLGFKPLQDDVYFYSTVLSLSCYTYYRTQKNKNLSQPLSQIKGLNRQNLDCLLKRPNHKFKEPVTPITRESFLLKIFLVVN